MANEQQEIMFRLNLFEQQMQQLNEQIEAIEKGINDLNTLSFGLEGIKGSTGKEILSPIGRGIFLRTTLASEDLTVDIGGKNFVKKSVPETKEIINEQIKKLIDVKGELDKNLEALSIEVQKALEEFQNIQNSEKKN